MLVAIIEKHLKQPKFHSKFEIESFSGVTQASGGSHDSTASSVRDIAIKGIKGNITPSVEFFREEERSKQNSIFSILREIKNIFSHDDSGQLGLYGSFGYDLTFQFEEIQLNNERKRGNGEGKSDRDLILFFPDQIFVLDNQKKKSFTIKYDFTDISEITDSAAAEESKKLPGYDKYIETREQDRVVAGSDAIVHTDATATTSVSVSEGPTSTQQLTRDASWSPYVPAAEGKVFERRDYPKGFFAESVKVAKNEFRVGNLFEVVLSQAFREVLKVKPSKIFRRYHTVESRILHLLICLFLCEDIGGKDIRSYVHSHLTLPCSSTRRHCASSKIFNLQPLSHSFLPFSLSSNPSPPIRLCERNPSPYGFFMNLGR